MKDVSATEQNVFVRRGEKDTGLPKKRKQVSEKCSQKKKKVPLCVGEYVFVL